MEFEEKITETIKSKVEGIVGYLVPLKNKIVMGEFEGHNVIVDFERTFIKIKSDFSNTDDMSFLITNEKINGSDEMPSSILNPAFKVFTEFRDLVLRFINKGIKSDLMKIAEKSKSSFEFYLHDGNEKDVVGLTVDSWISNPGDFFEILKIFLRLKSKLK